jgi:hypothetical protein
MTHDAWPGYRPSVKRQRKLEWLSNRQGPSTAKYRHPAECADLIAENDLDEPVVRHWLLAPRAHSFDIVGHHGFRAGPCQVPAVALALWRSGFIIASVATTLIIVACGTIPTFVDLSATHFFLPLMGFGARKFEGKKISIQLAQVGVSLWIVACSIGSIYARPEPERR